MWVTQVKNLVLYDNTLKRLRHTCYANDSNLLLQHNALSCHLPLTIADHIHPKVTLCAVGNQLQKPSPPWLSSFEQNGVFWFSETESLRLVFRLTVAVLLFLAVLLSQLGWKKIGFAMAKLHVDRGRGCASLPDVCASQLSCLSCRTVLCFAILMALMDWTYFECPRLLTRGSACHRDSTRVHFAVVLLWSQVVHWP